MNNKALNKMLNRSITNWHSSHKENDGYIEIIPFFKNQPSANFLYQHIQIYKLIQEYVELFEDCEKMNSCGKKMLEERMHEIEDKLLNEYWIVSKNQNDSTKWTWCSFDK